MTTYLFTPDAHIGAEVFKMVNGYEGLYSVSNLGSVFTHGKRSRLLKPGLDTSGYHTVSLYKEGKTLSNSVHRLVALAFVEGYKEGLQVNHIDENKTNNIIYNLEWVTQQYNMEYSRAKHYLITHPCGKEEVIFNLTKFCRENSLSQPALTNASSGRLKSYKGYKCALYTEGGVS